MARSRNCTSKLGRGECAVPRPNANQAKNANRLMDEVYREMFLLESHRPGAEMGLALALLRAYVRTESLSNPDEIRDWLKTICPIGLHMIENSLGEDLTCALEDKHRQNSGGSALPQ